MKLSKFVGGLNLRAFLEGLASKIGKPNLGTLKVAFMVAALIWG